MDKLRRANGDGLASVQGRRPEGPEQQPSHDRVTATIPVFAIKPGDSPRLVGQDTEHVARLAEVDGPLPPILVDRRSMRVIDGTHRLMAAILKGQETIDVEFFEGEPDDTFLLAVKANVSHGFPLSRPDRRAAATRIIASHPHLSDRAIAEIAGLGARTVAELRRDAAAPGADLTARVGKDGKVRPLNGAPGRQRAAAVIEAQPGASLREVARRAGVSLATASDVRKRLERGEGPVPTKSAQHQAEDISTVRRRSLHVRRASNVDPNPVLEKLVHDPSLRHNESGRSLLRLLRHNALVTHELSALLEAVPPHCGDLIKELASQYAEMWHDFARGLERFQT